MSEIKLIPYVNRTLEADATVQVPATLEDAIAMSSKDDVLSCVLKHSFYNGWNNDFRAALVAKFEELTGIKRRQQVKGGNPVFTTKKDGTQTPVLETEKSYINFLKSEGHVSEVDYLTTHAAVAETIPFEIKKAEEEKAPAREFLSVAKRVLAMVEAGENGSDGQPVTEESFTTKWESANPGRHLASIGGFTEEGIARALEIDDKRRKLELPAGLV